MILSCRPDVDHAGFDHRFMRDLQSDGRRTASCAHREPRRRAVLHPRCAFAESYNAHQQMLGNG